MLKTFLVLAIFLPVGTLFAQTPIFSLKSRGESETKSFTISGPATLTISASADSKEIDDANGVFVCLSQSEVDEISSIESWSLELSEKKRTVGTDSFRVRVKPGIYFFEVITSLDGEWEIRLAHDAQTDAYGYAKARNDFVITKQGRAIATAYDEPTAIAIVDLLNGSNK